MLNRRDFLRAMGVGALTAAAPALIEPERKLWFVGSNAPVGSRVERLDRVTAREWALKIDISEEQWERLRLGLERDKRERFARWALRQQQEAYAEAASDAEARRVFGEWIPETDWTNEQVSGCDFGRRDRSVRYEAIDEVADFKYEQYTAIAKRLEESERLRRRMEEQLRTFQGPIRNALLKGQWYVPEGEG